MMNQLITVVAVLCITAMKSAAQEFEAPLRPQYFLKDEARVKRTAAKTAALPLPFIDDFTDYSMYPNADRWTDSFVYVSNTMSAQQVSRGMATFDALGKNGRPYDTLNPNTVRNADSLTSQPINLADYNPGDSLYLSFLYQPQGLGFAPETTDSLMLFFKKKTGGWQKMWGVSGTTLQPFTMAMIPIVDTVFYDGSFQFRFVNRASINTNDDVWNLDYVRLAAGRAYNDTALNDIAFTTDPAPLLNDYTSMPYRHYLANTTFERASELPVQLHNSYNIPTTSDYFFRADDVFSGTSLAGGYSGFSTLPAYGNITISPPAYSTTLAPGDLYDQKVWQHKYWRTASVDVLRENDTIVYNQVFDNYLAYDDGTAEKSFFLSLFPTLPGKLAVEYHLNVPDTVKGFAVYFGQQAPSAYYKFFSIVIYTKLAGVNGASATETIYEQHLMQPKYTDEVNKFTYYKLESPVPLPAGTFYMGTVQPAASGSDSLYFGLDVNRTGSNHTYYNVLDTWEGSLITGAVMMRPLLGKEVIPTSVEDITGPVVHRQFNWSFMPNPVTGDMIITAEGALVSEIQLTDVAGHVVHQSHHASGSCNISMEALPPGIYFVRIRSGASWSEDRKVTKI